jgi:hypothetical protein
MNNALRKCTAYAPDLRVRGRGMSFGGAIMGNTLPMSPVTLGAIQGYTSTL